MPQRQRYLFFCTNQRADDHPSGAAPHAARRRFIARSRRSLRRAAWCFARTRLHGELSRSMLCRPHDPCRAGSLFLWPGHVGRCACDRRWHSGQGGHYHVGPVTEQIVHRHAHGVDSVFELLDHILLIAAPVGQTNDLLTCVIHAVAHIKKVTNLIERTGRPFALMFLRTMMSR